MPFIAGIDEAGYSPTLGPLVVTCFALRVDDADAATDGSDLWDRLAPHVVRPGRGAPPDGAIEIGDSKKVYTPARGIGRLERSVLSLAAWTADAEITGCDGLMRAIATDEDGDRPDWEDPAHGSFPMAAENSLPSHPPPFHPKDAEPAMLHARAVSPAEYNAGVARTDNKATYLWEIVASHLRQVWDVAGDAPCHVTVDRLGGRAKYAGPLADALGGWIWELEESKGVSAYRVEKDGRTLEVTFREKADDTSLPVAVASMMSKYLRELMMARLNGYFRRHNPDLKPTAGYPQDAVRFLDQTAELRRKLGVDDDAFIRCR